MAKFLLLPAALILFLLSINPTSTIATTAVILDTDGNPLRADSAYYIRPVNPNDGGGFTTVAPPLPLPFLTCPLIEVVAPTSGTKSSRPVKFTPLGGNPNTISLSTEVSIAFTEHGDSYKPSCPFRNTWTLNFDPFSRRYYVQVQEPPVLRGKRFKIEKADGNAYKLVYSPSSRDYDPKVKDLGVVSKLGSKWFGIVNNKNDALRVRFEKAPPTITMITTITSY